MLQTLRLVGFVFWLGVTALLTQFRSYCACKEIIYIENYISTNTSFE